MALETFYIVGDNGGYGCGDIGVSAQEWYSILQDKKAIPYIEVLLCFLREPEMKSTCVRLSDKYGKPPQYYNSKITAFSKWVQKKLSRFVVLNTDGEVSYWGIAMQKGWEVKNNFWWQLREELAEALREYLMRDLIRELGTREIFNGYYEEYKWALIDKTEGLDAIGIAKSILGQNIFENPHNGPALKYLIEQKPVELVDCCKRLFDENNSLSQRLAEFKTGMRSICPSNMNNCANDERTASALLACKYPYNYTFYKKEEVYDNICKYFGYEPQGTGLRFCHFTEIINKLAERYGEEVQTLMFAKISGFRNKPLNLAIQTLFWCMKEYIMNQMNTNKKFTWIPYNAELAQKLMQFRNNRKGLLDIIYNHRDEFLANYLHDQDGENDLFTDIDPFTTFGLYNRGIKLANRINTTKLFKQLLNIQAPAPDDFDGVPTLNNQKSHFFGFRKHRGKDDIENLWALFEKVVANQDFETEYNCVVKQFIIKVNITMALFWIRPNDFLAFDSTNRTYLKEQYNIDLPNKALDYKGYMNILNGIRQKMTSGEIKEKTFYELSANACNGSVSESDNEEAGWLDYITGILRKRKNLVLYGAPGTGKTYMVPELAVRLCDPDFDVNGSDREELMYRYNQLKVEKRISFTIFHQSMDYEDWLEGLRPIVGDSNQVTYEVEEGIFKRLCDEAENNTKPYVMVIDEMNRGNVSKIFGELITLLEVDKRKGCKNAESVMLPYSKKYFQIPDNVYIIATMNSADRSLGSIDYAVRRRFAFVACKPWGLMLDGFDSELFEMVSRLFIANYDEYASSGFDQFLKLQPSETLSEEYRPEDVWIGHSYFIMNDENGDDITSDRLYYEIIPLLEEYVRDGVLNPDAQDTIDELYKRAGQL